jgi:hypothetical protein
MSKPLTKEQFIEKSNKIHNNKYEYSLVEYKNKRTKVKIICSIHGVFYKTPHNHLIGQGCNCCPRKGGGFKRNKPGILYFLKFKNLDCWKVGITNLNVAQRYRRESNINFDIIKEEYYQNGGTALDKETFIKQKFTNYKYKGKHLLESAGNTEIFIIDVSKYVYKPKEK